MVDIVEALRHAHPLNARYARLPVEQVAQIISTIEELRAALDDADGQVERLTFERNEWMDQATRYHKMLVEAFD